eukprot:XP_002259481.1 Erythrocyte binding protein, putative [Plasmodium knowlesi strain H]
MLFSFLNSQKTQSSMKKQENYEKIDIVQEITPEIAIENNCECVRTAVERAVTVDDAQDDQVDADPQCASETCYVQMNCCSEDLPISESVAVENDRENVLSVVELPVVTDYSFTLVVENSEEECESAVATYLNSPRAREESEVKGEKDFLDDSVKGSIEQGLKVLPNAGTEDFLQMVKCMRNRVEGKFMHFKSMFYEGWIGNAGSALDSFKFIADDKKECIQDLMSFLEHILDHISQQLKPASPASGDCLELLPKDATECTVYSKKLLARDVDEYDLSGLKILFKEFAVSTKEKFDLLFKDTADYDLSGVEGLFKEYVEATKDVASVLPKNYAECDLEGVRALFRQAAESSEEVRNVLSKDYAECDLEGVRELFRQAAKSSEEVRNVLSKDYAECDLEGVRALFRQAAKSSEEVRNVLSKDYAECDLEGVRALFRQAAKSSEEVRNVLSKDYAECDLEGVRALFRQAAESSIENGEEVLEVVNNEHNSVHYLCHSKGFSSYFWKARYCAVRNICQTSFYGAFQYTHGQKYDMHRSFCNVKMEYNFNRGVVKRTKAVYRITVRRGKEKITKRESAEVIKGPYFPRQRSMVIEDCGADCGIVSKIQSESGNGSGNGNGCGSGNIRGSDYVQGSGNFCGSRSARGSGYVCRGRSRNGSGNGCGSGSGGGNDRGNNNSGDGSSDGENSSSDDQGHADDEKSSSEDDQSDEEKEKRKKKGAQKNSQRREGKTVSGGRSDRMLPWSSCSKAGEESLKREDVTSNCAYMLPMGNSRRDEDDLKREDDTGNSVYMMPWERCAEKNDHVLPSKDEKPYVRNSFKGNRWDRSVKREEESLKREDDFKREDCMDFTADVAPSFGGVKSERSGLGGDHEKSSSLLIRSRRMQQNNGIGESNGENVSGSLFDNVDLGDFAVAAAQDVGNQLGQRGRGSNDVLPGNSESGSSDGGNSEVSTHIDEESNDSERIPEPDNSQSDSGTEYSYDSGNGEKTITTDESDLEKETVHLKKVLVGDYRERSAYVMNRMRDTVEYMLPKVDEMPEDRKLNKIRNMYNHRPSVAGRTKYRKYADKEGGKNWKEISRVLKYAEGIVSDFISCFKEKSKFSPEYSTKYYYGKRIQSLYPKYRFSECKKIFTYFERMTTNPIIEKSRDEYLEKMLGGMTEEESDHSYIDIIKACRRIVLDIMKSIQKNIRVIGSADMKNKVREYRERYRNSTEEADGIYAEDHPYIIALKKIDDSFSDLRDKISRVHPVVNFFDYKMDRIIRTYASQLCYSYRFVHYWLHILTRLFTDVVQVWNLPGELTCQMFETCEEKRKVVVVRRMLVQIMKKFKQSVEDGSYKPHRYEKMETVHDAYHIYRYTKIFYDRLCEGFRTFSGDEIHVVQDVYNEICTRIYNVEPSSCIVYSTNRIIRRIGSTSPLEWPTTNEAVDLFLAGEEENNYTAENGSAGRNITTGADAGRDTPADEEEERDSSADEEAQSNAVNGSSYDGHTSDSSYHYYGNRPDTIEDSTYYNGMSYGSTEIEDRNNHVAIPCLMDIPRQIGTEALRAPAENLSHERSRIVGVVEIISDENGNLVEVPLENVQDNLEIITHLPLEAASSNMEFLDIELVETVENNSAISAQEPVVPTQNELIFSPQVSAASTQDGFIFSPREPVASTQNGFIFPTQESVGPTQNGLIFSPREPVASTQNGFIFSPREPVASTQNGFIFPTQESVGPTQNGLIFSPREPVASTQNGFIFPTQESVGPTQNGLIFSPREPVASTQNGFIFPTQESVGPTQNGLIFSHQESVPSVQTRGGSVQGTVGAVHNSSNFLSREPVASTQNGFIFPTQESVGPTQNSFAFSHQESVPSVQTRRGFVQGTVGAVHNSSNFWSQEPVVSVQNHGGVSVQELNWTSQNSGTYMQPKNNESARSENNHLYDEAAGSTTSGLSLFALAQASREDNNSCRNMEISLRKSDDNETVYEKRDNKRQRSRSNVSYVMETGYNNYNQNNEELPRPMANYPSNYDIDSEHLPDFSQSTRSAYMLDSRENNSSENMFKSESSQNQNMYNTHMNTWEKPKSEDAFFKGEVHEEGNKIFFHSPNPIKEDNPGMFSNDNLSQPPYSSQDNFSTGIFSNDNLSQPPYSNQGNFSTGIFSNDNLSQPPYSSQDNFNTGIFSNDNLSQPPYSSQDNFNTGIFSNDNLSQPPYSNQGNFSTGIFSNDNLSLPPYSNQGNFSTGIFSNDNLFNYQDPKVGLQSTMDNLSQPPFSSQSYNNTSSMDYASHHSNFNQDNLNNGNLFYNIDQERGLTRNMNNLPLPTGFIQGKDHIDDASHPSELNQSVIQHCDFFMDDTFKYRSQENHHQSNISICSSPRGMSPRTSRNSPKQENRNESNINNWPLSRGFVHFTNGTHTTNNNSSASMLNNMYTKNLNERHDTTEPLFMDDEAEDVSEEEEEALFERELVEEQKAIAAILSRKAVAAFAERKERKARAALLAKEAVATTKARKERKAQAALLAKEAVATTKARKERKAQAALLAKEAVATTKARKERKAQAALLAKEAVATTKARKERKARAALLAKEAVATTKARKERKAQAALLAKEAVATTKARKERKAQAALLAKEAVATTKARKERKARAALLAKEAVATTKARKERKAQAALLAKEAVATTKARKERKAQAALLAKEAVATTKARKERKAQAALLAKEAVATTKARKERKAQAALLAKEAVATTKARKERKAQAALLAREAVASKEAMAAKATALANIKEEMVVGSKKRKKRGMREQAERTQEKDSSVTEKIPSPTRRTRRKLVHGPTVENKAKVEDVAVVEEVAKVEEVAEPAEELAQVEEEPKVIVEIKCYVERTKSDMKKNVNATAAKKLSKKRVHSKMTSTPEGSIDWVVFKKRRTGEGDEIELSENTNGVKSETEEVVETKESKENEENKNSNKNKETKEKNTALDTNILTNREGADCPKKEITPTDETHGKKEDVKNKKLTCLKRATRNSTIRRHVGHFNLSINRKLIKKKNVQNKKTDIKKRITKNATKQ